MSALLAIAAPHRIKTAHRRRRRCTVGQSVFRDYDPTTGRYVQSDPIGLQGGISTFSYALASPLKWSDSLGLIAYHEPDLSRNTVVCDGRGNLAIQYQEFGTNAPRRCVDMLKSCTRIHEQVHINDILRMNKAPCRGIGPNIRVGFDTYEQLRASERRAFAASIPCLESLINGMSQCDECLRPLTDKLNRSREELRNNEN